MKLCLIGLDGVRWDVASQDGVAPTLMRLAAEGSVTPMWMTPPTDSGPGWSSILTGKTHAETRVFDNELVGHNLGSCPDLLSQIWFRDHSATTLAAVVWRQIADPCGRGPIIHTRLDQRKAGLHEIVIRDGETFGCVRADEEVQAVAARRILLDGPDATFVHLEGADEAGHLYGSLGREYRDAISRIDEHVRCLWKAVDERVRTQGERWLIAICTDHGHKPEGGHGEDEDEVRRSFLLLHSPTDPVPTFDRDLAPTDVVPILLDLTR